VVDVYTIRFGRCNPITTRDTHLYTRDPSDWSNYPVGGGVGVATDLHIVFVMFS
jgi:hypothetical protein